MFFWFCLCYLLRVVSTNKKKMCYKYLKKSIQFCFVVLLVYCLTTQYKTGETIIFSLFLSFVLSDEHKQIRNGSQLFCNYYSLSGISPLYEALLMYSNRNNSKADTSAVY